MAIADATHERLTRIGLAALADRGFALAGGYALAAHDIGSRTSEDVDLFTDRPGCDFDQATQELEAAYLDAGYQVKVVRRAPEFTRLVATRPDGGATAVDLARDTRTRPAVQLEVGPVLHLDDAIGAKVGAVYGRAAAKDFLDVREALRSGRFSRGRLLELGDAREVVPMDREIFAAQLDSVQRIDDREFARYGARPEQIAELRSEMAAWSAEIRAG
jgi:Nucleotidyl transferase AbiEii toxin, Type IV TA system